MALGWTGLTIRPNESVKSYLFECPKENCYYRVVGSTEEVAKHNCPHIGDTKIGWSMTKTLVAQVWDLLDDSMYEIMARDDYPKKESDKARARAFAEVLAIFMVPHFRTADDIAREAMRRYKAQQAGEEYETPGLGTLKYMTPEAAHTRAEGWYQAPDGGYTSDPKQAGTPVGKRRGQSHARKQETESPLDEQAIKAIKFAGESGMFTVADLAKTYSVSAETIMKVLG